MNMQCFCIHTYRDNFGPDHRIFFGSGYTWSHEAAAGGYADDAVVKGGSHEHGSGPYQCDTTPPRISNELKENFAFSTVPPCGRV